MTNAINNTHKTAKRLFVIGTGTDVGKTYITGLILKKLTQAGARAAYYKAAMSGNPRRPDGSLVPGDALAVREAAGLSQPLATMCPYVYQAAVSPHLAARLEGQPLDMGRVRAGLADLCARYDYVTMEGSGGIVCPLRWDGQHLLLADMLRELAMPAVLVADAGLGVINSAVLTADYMRRRGLALRGIIFNNFIPGDPMQEDNLQMCQELCGLPALACVERGMAELPLEAGALMSLYE